MLIYNIKQSYNFPSRNIRSGRLHGCVFVYLGTVKFHSCHFIGMDLLSCSPHKRIFRGPGGVVRGLDSRRGAKICARELASVVSRCLKEPYTATRRMLRDDSHLPPPPPPTATHRHRHRHHHHSAPPITTTQHHVYHRSPPMIT